MFPAPAPKRKAVEGQGHCDRKKSDFRRETKPVFHIQTESTDCVLRFDCVELNSLSEGILASERCEHFDLGDHKERSDQVTQL